MGRCLDIPRLVGLLTWQALVDRQWLASSRQNGNPVPGGLAGVSRAADCGREGGGVCGLSPDNDRSRTSSNAKHNAISNPVDRDFFVVERGAYEQFRNTR